MQRNRSSMSNRLEVEDFARLFGCDVADFKPRMVDPKLDWMPWQEAGSRS